MNREDTPIDEEGKLDYEVLEAVDVDLFNRQMTELLEGNSSPRLTLFHISIVCSAVVPLVRISLTILLSNLKSDVDILLCSSTFNGVKALTYIPYQDSADAVFNSVMVYELSVLKVFAEPALFSVPEGTDELAGILPYEARTFLSCILSVIAAAIVCLTHRLLEPDGNIWSR